MTTYIREERGGSLTESEMWGTNGYNRFTEGISLTSFTPSAPREIQISKQAMEFAKNFFGEETPSAEECMTRGLDRIKYEENIRSHWIRWSIFLEKHETIGSWIMEDEISNDGGAHFKSNLVYMLDNGMPSLGLLTMRDLYSRKKNGKVLETAEDTCLRVTWDLGGDREGNPTFMQELYGHLMTGSFTLATPFYTGAGNANARLSSCFLMSCEVQSMSDFIGELRRVVQRTEEGGGIGISLDDVGRWYMGREIKERPMEQILSMLDLAIGNAAQGCGKRQGACAAYLSVRSPDIVTFLNFFDKSEHKDYEPKNLTAGLVIPDDFMEAVRKNKDWMLIDLTDEEKALQGTKKTRYAKNTVNRDQIPQDNEVRRSMA